MVAAVATELNDFLEKKLLFLFDISLSFEFNVTFTR